MFRLWAVTLAAVIGSVAASSGDQLLGFQSCVQQCIEMMCPRKLPLHLRLLLWTCESDCDYICQQTLTDSHEDADSKVHQYHGKWPFYRVLGVQEPASVLFSIANFLPNRWGYRKLAATQPSWPQRTLKPYYLMFALVGVNAWTWSTVFHIRDFVLTERLDYFSAIGSIVYGLFLALVRIFRLDRRENAKRLRLAMAVCCCFYLAHISYLSFVHFNYAYNMAAGVVVGILQNVMWIAFGISTYRKTGQRIDLLPALIIVLVMMGMSFELFDFAPFFRVFDAHSLWHASTVLPTALWYKYLVHDLKRVDKYKMKM